MLIFDQLRKGDRPLQVLAGIVLAGLLILFGGLWYVQIVSGQRYQKDHQVQSYRTVRVPAVRGKILDRNRNSLAENRTVFNVSVFLDELRPRFAFEYTNHVKPEFWSGYPDRKNLSTKQKREMETAARLERQARYRAASNLLNQASALLQVPAVLNEEEFNRHYENKRSLALPLIKDLKPWQVARFEERSDQFPEMELEVQSVRVYPNKTLAAHVLGYLKRDDNPNDEALESFRFFLPDFVGKRGLELALDQDLRGHAGIKSVIVNNLAYRQYEEMLVEPEPGKNVILTIDRAVQQTAERALAAAVGSTMSGAVVVMDVHSGDILAMASAPTFDPNYFISPPTNWNEIYAQWEERGVHPNNAAHGVYEPGSTFKIIVALAGLESDLIKTNEIIYSPGKYPSFGRRPIDDTAPPGEYDFERAFIKSSNYYFITNGVRIRAERIIEMGRRFGLGEPTGLPTRQEASGYFPALPPSGKIHKRDGGNWMTGDTENFSIGHGEVLTTPLQMATLTAAIANGGKLLQPRLVSAIEPQENPNRENTSTSPSGVVRRDIGVSQRSLDIVRKAMLSDVENREATGHRAFIPDFKICSKTGTAKLSEEVKKTWFVSYAPYENPRYAVVVVVSGGAGISGGTTCAPVAREVFLILKGILNREQAVQSGPQPQKSTGEGNR